MTCLYVGDTNKFSIHAETGVITTSVNPTDREIKNTYNITITVTDSATNALSVGLHKTFTLFIILVVLFLLFFTCN